MGKLVRSIDEEGTLSVIAADSTDIEMCIRDRLWIAYKLHGAIINIHMVKLYLGIVL